MGEYCGREHDLVVAMIAQVRTADLARADQIMLEICEAAPTSISSD